MRHSTWHKNSLSTSVPVLGSGITSVTSQTHYGINRSVYFAGTQSSPYTVATNAAFATYPVTVEAWVYSTTTGDFIIELQNPTSGQYTVIGNKFIYQGDRLNSTSYSSNGLSWSINAWHHIAFTMWSSTASTTVADRVTLWVDGVAIQADLGLVTDVPNYTATGETTLLLGMWRYNLTSSINPYTGYISEVRVSNNARYGTAGATFTPPTAAMTNDTNTLLLFTPPNASIPATFTITVTNVSSLSYSMSGSDRNGSIVVTNPSLTFKKGDVIDFVLNAAGHPFWVKTVNGTGTANGASGVYNPGLDVGTVRWTIGSTGTFYYNCQFHSAMAGTITVTA
jgi:plastocyanin